MRKFFDTMDDLLITFECNLNKSTHQKNVYEFLDEFVKSDGIELLLFVLRFDDWNAYVIHNIIQI